MSSLYKNLLFLDMVESSDSALDDVSNFFIKKHRQGEDINSSRIQEQAFKKFNINGKTLSNSSIKYIKNKVEGTINEL